MGLFDGETLAAGLQAAFDEDKQKYVEEPKPEFTEENLGDAYFAVGFGPHMIDTSDVSKEFEERLNKLILEFANK